MTNTILSLLDAGLQASNLDNTVKNLGDRSTYLGMSEIAKAADCMRSAVASKVHAFKEHAAISMSGNVNEAAGALAQDASIIRSLRFQRGHWFEDGIVAAFKHSGLPMLSQLTIEHSLQIPNSANTVPLKAHLDLVLIVPGVAIHEQTRIYITEIKSCENIPEIAYSAHEVQLFGQIGLLQKHWYQRNFSLGENQQAMSFSDLVEVQYGLVLPDMADIIIEGHLLLVSMNDVHLRGPYYPNDIMLNVCLSLARDIWSYAEAVRSGQITLADVPTAKGWHPLCDFCEWNADCPRFEGVSMPELEDVLLELNTLKSARDISIQRVQEAEEHLKNLFHGLSPQNTWPKDWYSAITQRFRMGTCEGRKTLDKERLRSALTACMSLDEVEAIMQAAHKVGEPYERLYVSTIN